jgi:hypothetical protein
MAAGLKMPLKHEIVIEIAKRKLKIVLIDLRELSG